MTVQELIEELNKVEDKTLPVIVIDPYEYSSSHNDPYMEVQSVYQCKEYFRKQNTSQTWDCIEISGC